jgi:catechol 2,3-dioxygenase-like lactoylglutathione lyase family enzyme
MFQFDHVAITAHQIAASVAYYKDHFGAQVLYEDATWALLQIGEGGGKIALVLPGQHPPHLALRVTAATLEVQAHKHGQPIAQHRDGSRGIYVRDPAGNTIELICYPGTM